MGRLSSFALGFTWKCSTGTEPRPAGGKMGSSGKRGGPKPAPCASSFDKTRQRTRPLHFTALTTSRVRAKRPMALGITIRLLNISDSSHTRSLEARVPRKMNTRAISV